MTLARTTTTTTSRNLSGGQRQRVALARAVYAGADIFLFDDSLCQLDPDMARHIFQDVIVGYLHNHTRLFVTSNPVWLVDVPRILLVNQGLILHEGNYLQLQTQQAFLTLARHTTELQHQAPLTLETMSVSQHFVRKEPDPERCLTPDNETTLSWTEIWQLLSYGKVYLAIAFVIVLGLHVYCVEQQEIFLFVWCLDNHNMHFQYYMAWYVGLVLGSVALDTLKNYIRKTFETNLMVAVHTAMLQKVLHAPTSWHDSIPAGTIIGKLTSNFEELVTVIYNAAQLCYLLESFVVGLYYIVCSLPGTLLPILAAGLLFEYLSRLYRPLTNASLRLDEHAKDMATSRVQELLDGSSVLSAGETSSRLWVRDRVFHEYENKLRTAETYRAAVLWLDSRWKLISNYIFLYTLVLCFVKRCSIAPAISALLLRNVFRNVSTLETIFLLLGDFSTHLHTCKRLLGFMASIPAERMQSRMHSADWPSKGAVAVHELSLRYRKDTPYVLRNLNLQIGGGDKVGLVGRSGVGKSSLMLSLVRIIEPFHSLVHKTLDIDGQNAEQIPLPTLRSAVVMVPQETWLFEGTVRTNVDPLHCYSDQAITELLHKLRLTEVLGRKLGTKGGSVLDLAITENGFNLSQGERQLLCLARAFIKRPKILLLDEATSGLDEDTDRHLQEFMLREFKDTTMIVTAHRLTSLSACQCLIQLTNSGPNSKTEATSCLLSDFKSDRHNANGVT